MCVLAAMAVFAAAFALLVFVVTLTVILADIVIEIVRGWF